ncbi:FxSxx-COOH system tetratricopeptide repeat protein [Streptomyces sp. NPDC013157]|uniref:FxSxx-COOH system tetratricopeptide repeat protein n=1 Tax=Streptomyces sp. NPDC013157 TaxID=3364861 RepID=UPI003698DC03
MQDRVAGNRPCFFLSYAHTPRWGPDGGDPDHWVRVLFDDLCNHVRALIGLPAGSPAGFMDRETRSGEGRPEKLSENLAVCRVFVPLFSPHYFSSEKCGREWYAFHERMQNAGTTGTATAPAIVPVLWTRVERHELPDSVRHIGIEDLSSGGRGRSRGIYGLIKLGRLRDEYEETVFGLAERIVQAAHETRLPPGRPREYENTPSAFGSHGTGPRRIRPAMAAFGDGTTAEELERRGGPAAAGPALPRTPSGGPLPAVRPGRGRRPRRRDMTAAGDGRIITFYSYKGGIGRTMALANTAWILAANGKRVLAVDWDLEAPGLHRFFHPFLDPDVLTATGGVIDILQDYAWAATDGISRTGPWHLEFADVEQHAVSLSPERQGLAFGPGGSLDFLSAGRRFRACTGTASSLEWDNFYDRLDGGMFLEAMRDNMKGRYDYVLIDSRTGLSDTADICTRQMPDVLVDCFTLSDQSIDGAAEVAHSVADEHRERRIRVLPVPMRVDDGEKDKVEAGRAVARLKFAGLPKGPDGERLSADEVTAYWGSVEIPYKPYYAYEETLAVVGDRKGDPKSLLAAFERLTAAVTDDEVTALPQIPEQARLRSRDAFTRRRPQADGARVAIVYAAENRMWADWIESLLKRAGCTVTPHDVAAGAPGSPAIPGTRTLVLWSKALYGSRHTGSLLDRAADSGAPGSQVPVQVDEVRLPESYRDRTDLVIDLHGLDEAGCEDALLGALGLPGQVPKGGPAAPRFPGHEPDHWNVPQRNSTFTGRGYIIERLREQLRSGTTAVLPQHQALFGTGGVGKTQIALEYVHRFSADYDLVWWVPAESVESVVASLAELGSRIGAPGGEDMALVGKETVRMLSRGNPTQRWILVFDNADDPDGLAGYMPSTGVGHILITSRNQAWSDTGETLQVDVFPRQESVEHLSRRAPGLTPEEADQVADAVGDLPLAVEQAGAWLAETAMPTAEYLRRLTEETAAVMGLNQPADYPDTVAATWNVSIERLKERSPASVRLLQLCAFLAAEPIASGLLYGSDEMLAALRPFDPTLTESLLIGRLVREIGRLALAKVDQISCSIQVHRLVQAVVRSQMSEDERRIARHTVHEILEEARPKGDEPVDDMQNWPRFDIIWPHLGASDLRNCTEAEPRRLLIDRVRYLWKRGEFPRARQLAEELLGHWREPLGEDDEQYLYLRCQLAHVLRSQGLYVEARELDDDVLGRQRRLLGDRHPHTLITASGLSSDLAALGEYTRAVELAKEAHDGFSDLLYEAHPRTLNAAGNLALALRMAGRYRDARQIDELTLARRTQVHGAEHIYTLSSAENLGRDLREVGEYTESVAVLSRAYDQHKRVLGKDFPGTLRCALSLAVSLRRAGELEDARRLTSATLEQYRAQHTAPTPDSLACELNLAADLFAAEDREGARDVARKVLAEYVKTPGEAHPYTQAAMNNLAVFHWGCGDSAQAEEVFLKVLDRMTAVLGAHHPHTRFCSANYAIVLAETGRPEEAWEREQRSADALRADLGARHPETLAVVSNGALTLTALGRPDEARALRDEAVGRLQGLRRQLGENNGITRFALEERRVYRVLEPLGV